jgi:PhnB protein
LFLVFLFDDMGMSTNGVRPGFHTLTSYLQVAEAHRLIEFLKEAFQAEMVSCHEEGGHVRHAELRLGDSMLEVSEPGGIYPVLAAATHYYVADVDAVYVRALAAGGTSLAAPEDHPYGERGASVKDPCGNYWYLATWKS